MWVTEREKGFVEVKSKSWRRVWQPKLSFPFISQFFTPRKEIIKKQPFSNSRQFGIKSLYGERKDGNTQARVSDNYLTLLYFSTESNFGPFSKTWTPTQEDTTNNASLSKASTLASKDVMHFDDWVPICLRSTNDWRYKPLMEL